METSLKRCLQECNLCTCGYPSSFLNPVVWTGASSRRRWGTGSLCFPLPSSPSSHLVTAQHGFSASYKFCFLTPSLFSNNFFTVPYEYIHLSVLTLRTWSLLSSSKYCLKFHNQGFPFCFFTRSSLYYSHYTWWQVLWSIPELFHRTILATFS